VKHFNTDCANAVINIQSNYKNNLVSSETEFNCGAGTFIAGVAVSGEFIEFQTAGNMPLTNTPGTKKPAKSGLFLAHHKLKVYESAAVSSAASADTSSIAAVASANLSIADSS